MESSKRQRHNNGTSLAACSNSESDHDSDRDRSISPVEKSTHDYESEEITPATDDHAKKDQLVRKRANLMDQINKLSSLTSVQRK